MYACMHDESCGRHWSKRLCSTLSCPGGELITSGKGWKGGSMGVGGVVRDGGGAVRDGGGAVRDGGVGAWRRRRGKGWRGGSMA
jgi:hypothetical protein